MILHTRICVNIDFQPRRAREEGAREEGKEQSKRGEQQRRNNSTDRLTKVVHVHGVIEDEVEAEDSSLCSGVMRV